MRHLIVGDNHGFHHNLRKLLLQENVIDKKGAAINRDEFKVYCTGDLIDGDINKAGDILNLELMAEWFDAVCIGNHEYSFLGGRDFTSRRKHDRETLRLLLKRLDEGILVPSIVVQGNLLTHAGFSDVFDFKTAEDADTFIHAMWDAAPEMEGNIAVFDWKNNNDYGTYGDPTSGIFNLAWKKSRNYNFGQVVGHSIFYTGPIFHTYDNHITHWNIDVGAKDGAAMGGIIIDDVTNNVEPVFWGERKFDNTKQKKVVPLKGEYSSFDDVYYGSMGEAVDLGRNSIAVDDDNFLEYPTDRNKFKDKAIISSRILKPYDIKVGMELVNKYGIVWHVSTIHRGSQEVTLKNHANNTTIVKPLNASDWLLSYREYFPIEEAKKKNGMTQLPLSSLNDVQVLGDSEIIQHYRDYV